MKKCRDWPFSGSSTDLDANLSQVKNCISILDKEKGLSKLLPLYAWTTSYKQDF